MNKATIMSIKQQKIVYQHKKIGQSMGLVYSISVFAFIVLCFSCLRIMNVQSINDVFFIAESVFNPILPLYHDNSVIDFVSSDYLEHLKEDKDVKLSLPVRASQIEEQGTSIIFRADNSIMVLAPEDGIVTKIETNADGKKYIIIQHSTSISTQLVGLDVVGVEVGQQVKMGQELATMDSSNQITMSVLQNNQSLNIHLDQKTIQWEA